MPDEINIPDDLLQALLAARAAQRATEAYGADIATGARAAYPDDEQWLERASWPGEPPADLAAHDGPLWPAGQVAELDRLRAAAGAAWEAYRVHPAWVEAREAGGYDALRAAVFKAAVAAEAVEVE